MEKEILTILKDCPKGTKLYSPLYGDVIFERIDYHEKLYPIVCVCKNIKCPIEVSFDAWGRESLYDDMPTPECLLFPSSDQRDWSKFVKPVVPPFEIKRADRGDYYFIIDYLGCIIPETEDMLEKDEAIFSCGNYFNTREQAEYAAGKVKELLLSMRKEVSNE